MVGRRPRIVAPAVSVERAEDLVLAFIPPLVALLLAAEQSKGAPLTEAEVLTIRDSGTCMAVHRSHFLQVAEQRGYDDIDPDRAWDEWSAMRTTLVAEDDK